MKTIYLILFILVVSSVSTFAVEKKNPMDVRNYKTELNLTQSQISKIDAVYANFKARTKLQSPAQSPSDQVLNKVALFKERNIEIGKVLTKEQKKTYIEILKSQYNKQ